MLIYLLHYCYEAYNMFMTLFESVQALLSVFLLETMLDLKYFCLACELL